MFKSSKRFTNDQYWTFLSSSSEPFEVLVLILPNKHSSELARIATLKIYLKPIFHVTLLRQLAECFW